MKKTHKQTIFLAAILMAVLLPALGLTALQLEYTYPQLPGTQTVTSKSSLGDVIQYFLSAAVLIAVLAAIISLIVAGVQYLTSSGKPGQMQSAKSRIFNSVLGLAILFGSYLVLITVNPQLVLMKIERVPLTSGILLFSEEGYDKLFVKREGDLSDLIDRGEVRPLNYEIYDCEKEFGKLLFSKDIPASPLRPGGGKEVNFANFPFYAIGFWGEGTAKNVKVVAYSGKNFANLNNPNPPPSQHQPIEYTFEGKIKKTTGATTGIIKEEIERGSAQEKVANTGIHIITLSEDFFKSDIEFINKTKDEYDSLTAKERKNLSPDVQTVFHPPLSVSIQGTGPGIFLYSSEGQRYFLASHDNFSRGDIDFDNKAEWIEINNIVEEQGQQVKKYDYLATLHSESYSTGDVGIFFERRKHEGPIGGWGDEVPSLNNIYPKIYLDKDYYNREDVDLADKAKWVDSIDYKNVDDITDNVFLFYEKGKDLEVFLGWQIGNITPKEKSRIDKTYGEGAIGLKDASSIQIFEIDETATESCTEVRLCTEKGIGAGYCISFTPKGERWKGAYSSITLPLPFYVPVSIPEKLKGTMLVLNEDTGKPEFKEEEKKFAKKIKSIYIRGNCLVGLFENRVETPIGVLGLTWEDGTPGAHSEIFTKSDLDLTNNPIGMCGGGAKLKPGEGKPCAASIVVFPLKGE